jgi:hypothetical protein
MILKTTVILIASGILVVVAGWRLRQSKQARPDDVQASLPSVRHEPVGWVFGRMIGFPGADKPLLVNDQRLRAPVLDAVSHPVQHASQR